jgi:hypothetical protein
MAKRGRPTKIKSKIYFDQTTEDAIVAYNNSTDSIERDRIFTRSIYKPFYKIAENVYNKYKIQYMGHPKDAMLDAVVFMFERLHLFKGEKGRAFSYFTLVCRNYYFQEAARNFKELKRDLEIDGWEEELDLENDNSDSESKILNADFTSKVIPYLKANMEEIMPSEDDKLIGYISLDFFSNIDDLPSFNRKYFQKEIAEQVGLDKVYTPDRWKKIVTDAHHRLNVYYYEAKKYYLETGEMPKFRKYNKLTRAQVLYILDEFRHNILPSNRHGVNDLAKKMKIEPNVIRNVLNKETYYRKNYTT